MVHVYATLLVSLAAAAVSPAQQPAERLTLRDFALELRATWEPVTDTVYRFEQRFPLVRDLAPAAELARYDAERFRPLLPTDAVAVGDAWRIDPVQVLPFLRQLHRGATAELHHGGGTVVAAPGGWACLAAIGESHAEVRFRVHAEFLLEGDGERGTSSWFTPAQFRGRMVIDRQRGVVIAFELAVPSQSANVDINLARDGNTICDIGRVPRMELRGGAFPVFTPQAAITERDADDLLARKFYPFAAIEWLDLPAARAKSLATGKPLHVIALFGSLTDESC